MLKHSKLYQKNNEYLYKIHKINNNYLRSRNMNLPTNINLNSKQANMISKINQLHKEHIRRLKAMRKKYLINNRIIEKKPIASGGTGSVILLHELVSNKKIAVKQFNPVGENRYLYDTNRFIGEYLILSQLNHPNIVKVYEYSKSKKPYFTMEYIDGETIDKSINKKLDWNKIFEELIEAFCYLELKGVVHRDIKESNILITKSGSPKIIDFGFSKQIKTQMDNKYSVIVSSEFNTPNEIYKEKIYAFYTEIYYLGCLIVSLMTSFPRFYYRNIVRKMSRNNGKIHYYSFYDILYEVRKIKQYIEYTLSTT